MHFKFLTTCNGEKIAVNFETVSEVYKEVEVTRLVFARGDYTDVIEPFHEVMDGLWEEK